MTMKLKLISPIPPSVNHYLGYRSFGGKVSVYTKSEAKLYKAMFAKYVAEEIKKQNWSVNIVDDTHYYVDMVFYFPRIDMDAPNYDKCLLDAITDSQLIWEDDNVVCSRVNRIYYDTVNPRIEIEISCVDYIGIFDDVFIYDKFVDKCMSCSRFRSGSCSILHKAEEGRIQEEIKDYICSKYTEKKVNKRRKINE